MSERNFCRSSCGNGPFADKRRKPSKQPDVVTIADFVQQVRVIIIFRINRSLRDIVEQFKATDFAIRDTAHENIRINSYVKMFMCNKTSKSQTSLRSPKSPESSVPYSMRKTRSRIYTESGGSFLYCYKVINRTPALATSYYKKEMAYMLPCFTVYVN